jgi:hypothetical protein
MVLHLGASSCVASAAPAGELVVVERVGDIVISSGLRTLL